MCVAIELDPPLHTQMDYCHHLSVQTGQAKSEEKIKIIMLDVQHYLVAGVFFWWYHTVSFSIIPHLKDNQGVLAAGSRAIMTRNITCSFHVFTFYDVNK